MAQSSPPSSTPQSFMIGVLVDVSGSMKKAFALDRSVTGNVERTHAIVTTLNRIAKNAIAVRERRDRMFACAFGLKDTTTCDLISLLKYTSEYDSSQKATEDELESARKDDGNRDGDWFTRLWNVLTGRASRNGYNILINLATQHGAEHAEMWIRKALSEPQAGVLYTILSRDKELTERFIEKLPGSRTTALLGVSSTLLGSWGDVSQSTIEKSELHKLVHQAVNRFAKAAAYLKQPDVRKPVPRPANEVSGLLDKLLDTTRDSSLHSTESSTTIRKLLDYIKRFIFGETPMFEALQHAKEVFDQAKEDQKILFILSDGNSNDGEPFPISEELRKSGVTIIGCFLTSNPINHPKRLLYAKDPEWENATWDKGAKKLFDMCSSGHNTEIPVTYFVDAKWDLPIEGESRLFLQANSLDMVDEFCNIVFTHVKEGKCLDAMAIMLATVSTATYINVTNSEFEPKRQRGKTCYANAIAAVYHLAMRRIVGREGGVLDFKDILQNLTDKYGSAGSNAKFVIERTCHSYRLRYKELKDENAARHAINHRRPVVATFSLDHWFEFSKFYQDNQKGILDARDLAVTDPERRPDPGGHAVVLVRCEPDCLMFMNSWGTKWGDRGFFRIKNASVLPNMRFYDIYWEEDDLQPREKEAFKQRGTDIAKEYSQDLITIYNLDYECPNCMEASKVKDYAGHLLEAKCPKCHTQFKPDHVGVMESLYLNSH